MLPYTREIPLPISFKWNSVKNFETRNIFHICYYENLKTLAIDVSASAPTPTDGSAYIEIIMQKMLCISKNAIQSIPLHSKLLSNHLHTKETPMHNLVCEFRYNLLISKNNKTFY